MKLKKAVSLWLISLVAVIFLILAFYLLVSRVSGLPNEFLLARQNAAIASQKIVDLTGATRDKITAVNAVDFKGDVDEALNLIKDARDSNNEAQHQASGLALDMQKMAQSLNGIGSPARKQLAYESVALELSLVSEFIVYTEDLNNFLNSLAKAVATGSFADRRDADNYLRSVNGQANIINNLNQQFLDKIKTFDKTS